MMGAEVDMAKRAQGIVEGVGYDSDHGDPPIIYITICFKHFTQAFGGLMLTEPTRDDFVHRICALFGVTKLEETVGKDVVGLWCLVEHNEGIEGIEREGRRFTITGFRRVHWPEAVTSALEHRKDSIKSTLAWAQRRAREEREKLSTIEADWTEWETMPLL